MSEHDHNPEQVQQNEQQDAGTDTESQNIRREYYEHRNVRTNGNEQSCWSFGGWTDEDNKQ